MNNARQINQDSGNFEYYTPASIVEAARRTLGGIDLDPASSAIANSTVRARRYFTPSDNGLAQQWSGAVWMNHPFSREGNTLWIYKLVDSYTAGAVTAACCITFAATSEKWFQPLLQFPQCFLSPRTNYFTAEGKKKTGVTKGSVVSYLGQDVRRFACEFAPLGTIKIAFGAQP